MRLKSANEARTNETTDEYERARKKDFIPTYCNLEEELVAWIVSGNNHTLLFESHDKAEGIDTDKTSASWFQDI